ncbi:hypothetical protein B9J78_04885 [bacterium Unc6]|nr:hypothetical protein [bacterium Unc6]
MAYKRLYDVQDRHIEKIVENRNRQKQDISQSEVEGLIAYARQNNIYLASHDDDSEEKIQWVKDMGIQTSEFPVNIEAIETAKKQGIYVGLGAPNFLRGYSH